MLKKTSSVILIIAIISTSVAIFSLNITSALGNEIIRNDETGIPCKVLYQTILHTLNKSRNETFTKNEVSTITELIPRPSRQIETPTNLRGVEHLTSLRTFSLQINNNLTDISPLENLNNLRELNVSTRFNRRTNSIMEMPLSVLSTINNLNGLERLTITLTERNLSRLNLPNLRYLNISGSPNLISLKGIEQFVNLRDLTMWSTPTRRLFRLQYLPRLRTVDIRAGNIRSIKGIERSQIRYLLLEATNLRRVNLAPLSRATQLRTLAIGGSGIRRLPNLRRLRRLRGISNDNPWPDINRENYFTLRRSHLHRVLPRQLRRNINRAFDEDGNWFSIRR